MSTDGRFTLGGNGLLPPVVRGAALFLGCFSALSLIGRWSSGFDGNLLWVDLRHLPALFGTCLMIATALLLPAFALGPRSGQARRRVTVFLILLLTAVVAANVGAFFRLLIGGRIESSAPIPFSFIVLVALLLILREVIRNAPASPRPMHRAAMAGTLGICVIAFPLGQMVCFGRTSYARPADAVVVFGARAYSDGRPSAALADRVRTACELYRSGISRRVIFSGGPGDGAIHEVEAMRGLAVSLGVDSRDILLDRTGLSTRETVAGTVPLLRQIGARRTLAVSHNYHLPRVKMAYQQAGIDVHTVPARERYTLRALPYLMSREVAAFWKYYLERLI